MKKTVTLAIFTGIFTAISLICTLQNSEQAISQSVIRLHIRANSNIKEDQQLKLKVRDRLLEEGREIFGYESDKDNARATIVSNLDAIKETAQQAVRESGYNYPVSVSFGKNKFPSKVYGDICLPAGTYEALTVEIGKGRGANWWCVMFPPLCFVEESCNGIPAMSRDVLIKNMGEENYRMISSDKPQIKFKIYELWKKMSLL